MDEAKAPNDFDEIFNPEAMDQYKESVPSDYPVQPASKRTIVKGANGAPDTRTYLPTYGLALQGPAVIEDNFFGDKAYKLQFRTLQPCPQTKLRSTVFVEFARAVTLPQLRVLVEAQLVEKAMKDGTPAPTEVDINETFAKRVSGIGFSKFLQRTLAQAISPLTLRDLLDAEVANGLVVGGGLRVREIKGKKRNDVVEFTPISAITDSATEGESGAEATDPAATEDDIPF